MRLLVLLAALAMPVIAWLSNRGVFGPDNGTVSDRYPTLLVAAGYAFAIWGLIFALDVAWGLWQATLRRRKDRALDAVRRPAAIGFALTASWMVVFPMELFWLALVIIWAALAAVVQAWLRSLSAPAASAACRGWAPWTMGLHAGWLSLAVFLNTAQVVVAHELLAVDDMLPWSAVLWAGAGALVLGLNRLARGQLAYAAAVLWGLVAVVVAQSASPLPGAGISAAIAAVLATLVAGQTAWLHWQRHDTPRHAF
jgi:hypothetical protein